MEAFRSLNALWHFTNFTVAHSHITMYGFVSFLIWGGIYDLLPRLTGQEPPHLLIGVHFWFALIGILIYGISLMIGGTKQGESWISGAPFIDSVRLMASYWLWRKDASIATPSRCAPSPLTSRSAAPRPPGTTPASSPRISGG